MQSKWKYVLLAVLLNSLCLSVVFAQRPSESEFASEQVSPTQLVHEVWREKMANITPPAIGCFHAKYPSTILQRVPCKAAPSQPFLLLPQAVESAQKFIDHQDYILRAPQSALLARVIGSFPSMSGVTSVSTEEGTWGEGPNQYSLQINTDITASSVCNGQSGCSAWEQFVYSTRYPTNVSDPALLIEHWLFGYSLPCPSGWIDYHNGNCMRDSSYLPVPNIPITELKKVQLMGFANQNGTDVAALQYGDDAYYISDDASLLNIARVWKDAEFNVVGNGGEAVFNKGSSITVKVEAYYDNLQLLLLAPTCVPGGTTGEYNNLTLGKCSAAGYPLGNPPYIQFTESN
jgi:hypothetical protein